MFSIDHGDGFLMTFLTWKGRGLVPGMYTVCCPGRTCILTFVSLGFLRNLGGKGEPSDCLKGGRSEWYECKHGSEEIHGIQGSHSPTVIVEVPLFWHDIFRLLYSSFFSRYYLSLTRVKNLKDDFHRAIHSHTKPERFSIK